jgi:hypothetical protein
MPIDGISFIVGMTFMSLWFDAFNLLTVYRSRQEQRRFQEQMLANRYPAPPVPPPSEKDSANTGS